MQEKIENALKTIKNQIKAKKFTLLLIIVRQIIEEMDKTLRKLGVLFNEVSVRMKEFRDVSSAGWNSTWVSRPAVEKI